MDKREPLVHHGVCASGAAGSHRGDGSCSGIWGIEATQAIQFFRSTHPLCPGPGASRIGCPDNSVPMVAERPTVLRLYVSGASPGANVGAAVTSPSTGGGYGSTFTLVGTGSMVASAAPAVRGNPATTLQVAR